LLYVEKNEGRGAVIFRRRNIFEKNFPKVLTMDFSELKKMTFSDEKQQKILKRYSNVLKENCVCEKIAIFRRRIFLKKFFSKLLTRGLRFCENFAR